MDKNYVPGVLWTLAGIICLIISYSGSEYHFVIKGTHISFGWLALAFGLLRLIFPPDSN